MSTFSNWNSRDKHVQSGVTAGQALAAQHVLIAFGPPFLGVGGTIDTLEGALADEGGSSSRGTDVVFPAGMVAQMSIGMQRALIPVPEIGSTQQYTAVGPMSGSINMGRTLLHGPSALRSAMSYFKANADGGEQIDPLIENSAANLRRNPLNLVQEAPGYENLWWNLNSEVFEQPLGILVYIKDTNSEPYGAVYFENVNIGNLGVGISVGQVVMSEQMSMTFSRVRPMRLASVVPVMGQPETAGTTAVAGTQYTTGSGEPSYIATNTPKNR